MHTRPAAVAGSFYPADPSQLSDTIDRLLTDAPDTAGSELPPKALIVPHAGYIYSGPTAAAAYRLIQPHADLYRRVVILGPAHRVPVECYALPSAGAFETPLGNVPVDAELRLLASALPGAEISEAAHALEHALEVQLPFLQMLLPRFTVLPVVVGGARPEQVAALLDTIWGGDETLLIISSDLSHYHPYDVAQARDRRTVERILALDDRLDGRDACGARAICGLIQAAPRHAVVPQLLDLRNSGDTAGDKSRVVGYAALSWTPLPPEPATKVASDAIGESLLVLARRAVADALAVEYALTVIDSPMLTEPRATFVTLKRHGRLRGCIGTLRPWRTLREDLTANAVAAALRDPRFAPMTAAEWAGLSIEVSLLSMPEPWPVQNETDAIARLQPGVDGLVFEYGGCSATFLPQVWDALPEAASFLARLKEKAGLPSNFWSDGIRLSRYTVSKWRESTPMAAADAEEG